MPLEGEGQDEDAVGLLQPEELTTIVIDEAKTLRKRLQLKELLLIETTYATSHPTPPFSKAVAAATAVISADKDDTFNAAIDIRRARVHRITPLGRKSGQPAEPTEAQGGERVELTLEEAPAQTEVLLSGVNTGVIDLTRR